ncbi:MAG: TSUP family transporter, partial [Niabella sp.]
KIQQDAHYKGRLINIADKPELCDFYLGSVVKKGQLKIAISTNGKSPTIAKRLRETFEDMIPDQMDELLENMGKIRDRLGGDFNHKVKVLNEVTKTLVDGPDERLAAFTSDTPDAAEIVETSEVVSKATKRTNWYLIILGILLFIVFTFVGLYEFGVMDELLQVLARDHHIFYWMLLAGFLAEIVAGSMGMGYGVICTTTLLMMNIPPPVVSASIHSAESFTTAAGSISHWKLGNINKKLIKALALPAVIGAVIGALALSYFGEHYAKITKPFIAAYTLYLGITILKNAFKTKEKKIKRKKTNITTLGLVGGFIDSFGGGGWGPLVTGTFIKNGRTPRYVIGSSTVAKFILTVTSAITFIFTIGIHHWNIVAGLLIGGIITAPFSAMLTSRLPVKKMFAIVGTLVIIMSLITIYRGIFH